MGRSSLIQGILEGFFVFSLSTTLSISLSPFNCFFVAAFAFARVVIYRAFVTVVGHVDVVV